MGIRSARDPGVIRIFSSHQSLQSQTRSGQAGAVAESMEKARRWSGYVCPDCRFVFRVPRDHDGKGIVCPSCRRMLRIPTSADQPPPLLAPKKEGSLEESSGDGVEKIKKRRRSKKSGSADHSWETAPKVSRLRRGDLRRMRLLLAGTGFVFLTIVAGVIYLLTSENRRTADEGGVIVESSGGDQVVNAESSAPVAARSDVSVLEEAEPLVRSFLEATSMDELLPLVRNPEVAESRMRDFYPDGKVEALGMSNFNPSGRLTAKGTLYHIPVQTKNIEDRVVVMVDTPEGLKVDWEGWVGWSDMPWEQFMAAKPNAGHVFRVIMSPVDYYNFGFSDDLKWQSYRLESPDKEQSLYGYVEKDSILDHRLLPNPDMKNALYTLLLKFPENPGSDSQVLIDRLIGEGWVEEEAATP